MDDKIQFQKEWYSLEYPADWQMDFHFNIPILFNPIYGKGAMQIFPIVLNKVQQKHTETFSFLQGDSLNDKMYNYLKNQDIEVDFADLKVYELKHYDFIAYEYFHKDTFYFSAIAQKDDFLIFAIYNCKDQPNPDEAKHIIEIVKSFRIHSYIK